MSPNNDVLELIRQSNPLPTTDWLDEDEAAAGVASIESAWLERAHPTPDVPRVRPLRLPGRRWVRPLVAGAAIVLFLVGVPTILLNGQDAPVTEEPETTASTSLANEPTVTTTPVEPTDTTTPVPALVPMPGLTFTKAPHIAAFDDGWLEEIISGGPGLIAVGTTQVCSTVDGGFGCVVNAAVWVSADGVSWRAAGDPIVFMGEEDAGGQGGTQWISNVAAGPSGIVAVGYDGYDGAAWFSQNGIDWSRSSASEEFGGSDLQSLDDVVSRGPGFVAVGRDGSDAGVWVSENGVDWLQVEDPDLTELRDPAELLAIASTPSGFVALGEVGFDEGAGGQGTGAQRVLWDSTDGLEWVRLPEGTLEQFGVDEIKSIQGGNGFLMIGSSGDSEGIWTSEDGRIWQQIDVPYMGSSYEVGTVDHIGTSWDGSRWVSIGLDASGTVWASFELGVPWQPVGHIEITDTPSDVRGVTATDFGIVIALATWENSDEDMRAVIWTGTWED